MLRGWLVVSLHGRDALLRPQAQYGAARVGLQRLHLTPKPAWGQSQKRGLFRSTIILLYIILRLALVLFLLSPHTHSGLEELPVA